MCSFQLSGHDFRSKKVMVFAPRNHPNLFHIVKSLNQYGAKVFLVIEYRTRDGLKGNPNLEIFVRDETQQSFATLLWSIEPDLIVQRYFPRNATTAIRNYTRQTGTRWIQYDQRPMSFGFYGRAKEIVLFILRKALRRPKKRITPVATKVGSMGNFVSSFNHPFFPQLPKTKEAASPEVERLKIVTVGKLWQKRKRILFLIKVLAQIRFDGELVIISATHGAWGNMTHRQVSAEVEKLKNAMKKANGNFQLRVMPDLAHELALHELSKADIFCLPSVREPFAISPMEAMGFGIPVIISRSNGAISYVSNQKDGIIFKPDSGSSLGATLLQLIQSDSLRAHLGTCGKHRLEKYHGPESLIRALAI